MNLFSKLKKLDSESKHVKIGLIGAGKFATMYLAQIKKTPGIKLVAIADIQPDIAKENLKRVDWSEEEFSSNSIEEAIKNNKTFITEDYKKLVDHDDIQITTDAFIELLLLSKCDKIIGTYASSFDEVAWWMSGCKSKVIIPKPQKFDEHLHNLIYVKK